ncbi:hypothetical protein BGX27_009783 [Mortierella sp. AM989]|nr:hypothetical protein BGX27_009783 [Mortierella sp. AM989]
MSQQIKDDGSNESMNLQDLTQQLSRLFNVIETQSKRMEEIEDNITAIALSLSTSNTSATANEQLHGRREQAPPGYQTQQEVHQAKTEMQGQELTSSSRPLSSFPTEQKSEKKPLQQQKQQGQERLAFYDDVDSPQRQLLRNKIDYVKNLLFEIENNPSKDNTKPAPPGDLSPINDEVYIIWCAAWEFLWYKQELFRLIEKLQAKEEEERKVLREMNKRVYENDDSPYRKHLRARIAAIKNAIIQFQPQKTKKKLRPDLPLDPNAVSLDVFQVWCLRSRDYSGCRVWDRYVRCQWQCYDTFEMELGCLIESLLARDEEERLYLVNAR